MEFLAHAVHPDGSVGGVYGSRHTHLYVPGGLERLARQGLYLPSGLAITEAQLEQVCEAVAGVMQG